MSSNNDPDKIIDCEIDYSDYDGSVTVEQDLDLLNDWYKEICGEAYDGIEWDDITGELELTKGSIELLVKKVREQSIKAVEGIAIPVPEDMDDFEFKEDETYLLVPNSKLKELSTE